MQQIAMFFLYIPLNMLCSYLDISLYLNIIQNHVINTILNKEFKSYFVLYLIIYSNNKYAKAKIFNK